ncbi:MULTISPECIES: helix-turn-helix domain-containing protein [Romboutsia]|uniref:Immunity repressor protein n=1 Tax=Romboutsia hominis TaxID=1507512 RepID=A0A2P2BQ90_9FIRM|nr:helix-turn-helix transcriptional regulator [Romboutsia hominis]CEI72506.1 Immunity repressor protein [Romboutsia hominis]
METLSMRLKALRKEKGLTLEELAKELDTTKVTLSRYENGIREPKGETLNKLANYFNVSTDYLFARTDDKNYISDEGIADVKLEMDKMLKKIGAHGSLMFDGEPMTDEELDSFLQSMEVVLTLAKKKQESKLRGK